MRSLPLAAAVAGALAVALAPAAAAEPPDPCSLVSASQATPVFGATPTRTKTTGVTTRSCTYSVKRVSMTLETRTLRSASAFVNATKATKGLVLPIATLANAFSAENGHEMLLWKNGVEVTITFVGVDPVFATQATLASDAFHGL